MITPSSQDVLACQLENSSLDLALASTALLVPEEVETDPIRSFLATVEVERSPRAVECQLTRLSSSGEVIRVRKGLYWKEPRARLRTPLTRPDESPSQSLELVLSLPACLRQRTSA